MFLSVCKSVDKVSILHEVTMCHWVFGSREFVTTGFPVSSELTDNMNLRDQNEVERSQTFPRCRG